MPYSRYHSPIKPSINKTSRRTVQLKADKSSGFTLIEVIIGIVTMSLALSIITTLLLPTADQSAEQIHQIRASELGQSLMNEITSKAFDENSDMSGGEVRCGEEGTSCSTILGSDGEAFDAFNDVDDYNDINMAASDLNPNYSELYRNFTVEVTVCNDSNYDGQCLGSDDNQTAKLITITITPSIGSRIVFSTYKANY